MVPGIETGEFGIPNLMARVLLLREKQHLANPCDNNIMEIVHIMVGIVHSSAYVSP